MIGVVLWSDAREQKAVIWCEDHGNLAFFSEASRSALSGQRLDAGDVVQFELSEDRHLRVAHNPRLVAEDEYPTLAQDLRSLSRGPAEPERSRVVRFPRRKGAPPARKLSA